MRLIDETELAACGIDSGACVLVGLSGGADSVALLYALDALRRDGRVADVCAAHLHHGIRGAGADGDAAFCEALCNRLSIRFFMGRVDAPACAKADGMTLEEAARSLRYAFLRSCAAACGADVIAVAHHADDQAETVLMHLLRGSGGNGLTGMRMRSGDIVRPFLHRRRSEIEAYLRACGQDWRTDETNAAPDATRNRVRHELLPLMQTFNPRITESVCRMADSLAEDEAYLNGLARQAEEQARLSCGHDRKMLAAQPGPVRARALMLLLTECLGHDVCAADVRRFNAALCAQNGCCIELRGGNAVWIENDAVRLGIPKAAAAFETAFVPDGVTLLPDGRLTCKRVSVFMRPENGRSICVNGDAIPVGASVRTRRAGDRIHPLGAPGSKLLSDYLIDKKVPRSGRDMPLLCDGDEVLWVIGGAVSERLRVDESTRKIVRICYEEVGEHGLDER